MGMASRYERENLLRGSPDDRALLPRNAGNLIRSREREEERRGQEGEGGAGGRAKGDSRGEKRAPARWPRARARARARGKGTGQGLTSSLDGRVMVGWVVCRLKSDLQGFIGVLATNSCQVTS